ncbi:hypothetical protein AAC387_Pa09g0839 [Persea americana]
MQSGPATTQPLHFVPHFDAAALQHHSDSAEAVDKLVDQRMESTNQEIQAVEQHVDQHAEPAARINHPINLTADQIMRPNVPRAHTVDQTLQQIKDQPITTVDQIDGSGRDHQLVTHIDQMEGSNLERPSPSTEHGKDTLDHPSNDDVNTPLCAWNDKGSQGIVSALMKPQSVEAMKKS